VNAVSRDTPELYPDRIQCSRCHKPCSTEVPIGTKIRGVVWCDACLRDFVEANEAAERSAEREVADTLSESRKMSWTEIEDEAWTDAKSEARNKRTFSPAAREDALAIAAEAERGVAWKDLAPKIERWIEVHAVAERDQDSNG
jgi:hypothetical protein